MNNPYTKMTLFQLTEKHHNEAIGMVPDSIKYMLDLDPNPVWMQTLVARTDLVRRVGGLDPDLRFGEDDDFLFRLACETNLCFVSMPMVLIDRTPPAQRHVGAGKNWDRVDFRLRISQYRFEKRLRMSEGLPIEVRNSACRALRAVHSGWANWYLQNGEYGKAWEAVSQAANYGLTPNIAIKWVLTRIAPKLARKVVSRREQKKRAPQLRNHLVEQAKPLSSLLSVASVRPLVAGQTTPLGCGIRGDRFEDDSPTVDMR